MLVLEIINILGFLSIIFALGFIVYLQKES